MHEALGNDNGSVSYPEGALSWGRREAPGTGWEASGGRVGWGGVLDGSDAEQSRCSCQFGVKNAEKEFPWPSPVG